MKLCEWFRRYSREVCQRGTLFTAPLEIGSGRTIYSLVLILYLVALFNFSRTTAMPSDRDYNSSGCYPVAIVEYAAIGVAVTRVRVSRRPTARPEHA